MIKMWSLMLQLYVSQWICQAPEDSITWLQEVNKRNSINGKNIKKHETVLFSLHVILFKS